MLGTLRVQPPHFSFDSGEEVLQLPEEILIASPFFWLCRVPNVTQGYVMALKEHFEVERGNPWLLLSDLRWLEAACLHSHGAGSVEELQQRRAEHCLPQ